MAAQVLWVVFILANGRAKSTQQLVLTVLSQIKWVPDFKPQKCLDPEKRK